VLIIIKDNSLKFIDNINSMRIISGPITKINLIKNSFLLMLIGLLFFNDSELYVKYSNVLIFLFIVTGSFYIIKFNSFKVNIFLISYLFLGFLSLVSILYSVDRELSLIKSISLILIFAFIFILYNILKLKFDIEEIMSYIINVSVFFSVYLLIDFLLNFDVNFYWKYRLGAKLANPNTIGLILSTSYLFSLYKFINTKKKFYIIFLLILLLTVLLTGSRKSIGLIFVSSIFLPFLNLNLSVNKIIRFSFITTLFVSILILLYANNAYFRYQVVRRFENTLSRGSNFDSESDQLRYNMLIKGVNIFFDSPLFGHGADTYKHFSENYFNKKIYSHNNYIELLVGTGLFGLFLFYLPIFLVFLKLFMYIRISNNKLLIYTLLIYIFLNIFLLSFLTVLYYDKFTLIILTIISFFVDNYSK